MKGLQNPQYSTDHSLKGTHLAHPPHFTDKKSEALNQADSGWMETRTWLLSHCSHNQQACRPGT